MKPTNNRRTLSIMPIPRNPDKKPNLHHPDPMRFDSSSMAMAALILLLALFFLCFFSAFTRRLCSLFHSRNSRLNLSHSSPRPRRFISFNRSYGIDPEILQSLPVVKAKRQFKELGYCCVVCLSDFEERECVKIIPRCSHVFHPGCIDPWLLSKGSCPICRCSDNLLMGSRSCSGLESIIGDDMEDERESSEEEEEEEREERKVVVLGRSCSWGHKRETRRDGVGGMRRACSF